MFNKRWHLYQPKNVVKKNLTRLETTILPKLVGTTDKISREGLGHIYKQDQYYHSP